MDEVARRHPHIAYTGLQKSLHQDGTFVQRITPVIWMLFQAV